MHENGPKENLPIREFNFSTPHLGPAGFLFL